MIDRKTNYKAEFENDRERSGGYCKSNPPMLKDMPVSRMGGVSGVLASNEYPRYDEEEEEGFASWAEGDEEELEIELSEDRS